MKNTAHVIDFIVGSRFEDIPAKALAVAKGAMLDCVGVALAGARQPGGMIPAQWARGAAGAGQATVWGHDFRASAHDAALVNGTAAHALDYDDVTWGLIGHPSVSLVPATFALGELLGASGREVLHAYVVGFEVMAKLGRTTQPRHSLDGGWHATGTIGAFGATAACCKLLGLDAEKTGHALGTVYSMTSGNVSNFGTMCKPLHAGLAARNAVEAALWATRRTSPRCRIRSTDRAASTRSIPAGLPADMTPLAELGRIYELVVRGVVIKPYPCGVALHPAIDAVHALKREAPIDCGCHRRHRGGGDEIHLRQALLPRSRHRPRGEVLDALHHRARGARRFHRLRHLHRRAGARRACPQPDDAACACTPMTASSGTGRWAAGRCM